MKIVLDDGSEFPKVIKAFAPIPYGGYSNKDIGGGLKLTNFTGNQHNESWAWDETKLSYLLHYDKKQLCKELLEPLNIHVQGI